MEAVSNDQSDHEVESALQIEEPEQPRIDTSPYLDRCQNTLTSDDKSFGSMNMDEFLNNIWTEEEIEAQAQNANPMVPTAEASTSLNNMSPQYDSGKTHNESSNVARPMSLPRQGSPSVPEPSCQKTVEEVWSEISRPQQRTSNIPHAGSRPRELSYGELTLQEFLAKVRGVCEEGAVAQIRPPRPHYRPHPALPVFQPCPAPPVFQARPAQPIIQPRPALPVFQPHPAPPVIQPRPAPLLLPRPQLPYGMYLNYDSTTMSNFMMTGCNTGSVGVQPVVSFYGGASGVRGTENFGQMTAVSLDGIGKNKRMIRNRESATKSRARKQAYNRELEEEVNKLKQENSYLRQRLEAAKTKEKQGLLRRTFSCPY